MSENEVSGVWTEDERPGYGRINGRRWRYTDTAIPAALKQELIDALMTARRWIASAQRNAYSDEIAHARRRVHVAKIALGERGPRWWLPMDEKSLRIRVRATVLVLLDVRGESRSTCPTEIARVTRGDDWRLLMPLVLDEAWHRAAEKHFRIMQQGEVASRHVKGPIRLAQGSCFRHFWDMRLDS